jgi:hypothetical protein
MRDDLVAGGKLRLLQEVDHFDRISTLKVLLTDAFEIANRAQRFIRLARHIRAEFPMLTRRRFRRRHHRSSPTL